MTGKVFGIPLVVIVLVVSIVGLIIVVQTMFNDALHKRLDTLEAQNNNLSKQIDEVKALRKQDLYELVQPTDAVNEVAPLQDLKPVTKPKVTQPTKDTNSGE